MFIVSMKQPDGQVGCRFIETDIWREAIPAFIAAMQKQKQNVETREDAEARIGALVKEIIGEEPEGMLATYEREWMALEEEAKARGIEPLQLATERRKQKGEAQNEQSAG
jgi:hypothetical protein